MRLAVLPLALRTVCAALAVIPAAAQTGPVILPDQAIFQAFAGRSVSIQFLVQNPPPNASLQGWAIASGQLPAGLSLNPATGLLSGTPTTIQSVTFTVRATYLAFTGQPLQYSRTYSFHVDAELVFLTSSPLPPATAQVPFQRQIRASLPVSSWSFQSNFPPGIQISAPQGSSQMTISGNFPAVTNPVTYTLTVTITGGSIIAQQQSRTYEIRVHPAPSLSAPEAVARLGSPTRAGSR